MQGRRDGSGAAPWRDFTAVVHTMKYIMPCRQLLTFAFSTAAYRPKREIVSKKRKRKMSQKEKNGKI